MSQTLRLSKNILMKLGNLQVQPVENKQPNIQATQLQTIVKQFLTITNLSLAIPTNKTENKIIPNFGKQQSQIINTKKTDLQSLSTKKIKPYEELTGISQERPEIIMLTNFSPIFEKETISTQQNSHLYEYMTDAGKFIDIQLQARQLSNSNLIKLYSELGLQYSDLKSKFSVRNSELKTSLESLKNLSQFLVELLKISSTIKSQLDLRDSVHSASPQVIIDKFIKSFSKFSSTNNSVNELFEFDKRYLSNSISISDALVKLGYKLQNVRDEFSSTKTWLQLTYELKKALEYHTLGFIDSDLSEQKNDNNAIRISQSTTKRFGLSQKSTQLLTINDISQLTTPQLKQSTTAIRVAWDNLYESVNLKNETKVAALINLLSKEYRYSKGLTDPNIQQTLLDYYDYRIDQNQDNEAMFDNIIGKFGTYITEFPKSQTNSLTNLAQNKPQQDIGVLTFESKYIESAYGIATPGSEYYIDYILESVKNNKFDTTRIDELGNKFDSAHKNFSKIIDGFNLLAINYADPHTKQSSNQQTILSNPLLFVDWVLDRLINRQNGQPLKNVLNDNLGSVISHAVKNDDIKSLLFLLVMTKLLSTNTVSSLFHINNAQKNSASLINDLVEKIVLTLESSIKKTSIGNKDKQVTITSGAIRSSLKNGTVLLSFIENIMRIVLTQFKYDSAVITSNRTKYSGMLDTMVMMITFDIAINTISDYCGQNMISFSPGSTTASKGLNTFYISRTTSNNRTASSSLVTKLEKEIALNHNMIYAVLHTLQCLSTSLKNYSTLLKSNSTTKNITTISNILNDNNMLNLLLNEQQIMLFANTVQDLSENCSQNKNSTLNVDVDADGDYDLDDLIKIIDSSTMTSKIKNALYSLFGNDDYASKLGYNKKILTVGIPLGFSEKLKQLVSIKNKNDVTFIDKQNDIIQVVVYKIDLQNSDIVYKPCRFLFELSRYPVRNDKYILNLKTNSSLDQVVRAFPTRDLADLSGQNFDPQYWVSGPTGSKIAFNDSSYSFLKKNEQTILLRNHVISYLCESYIKILTGIDVSEKQFDLIEQERTMDQQILKDIIECYVATIKNKNETLTNETTPVGGVLFSSTSTKKFGVNSSARLTNATGLSNSSNPNSQFTTLSQQYDITANGTLDANLSTLSNTSIDTVINGLKTISSSTKLITSISSPESVLKRTLSPKAFDRVFSVIVDPDDFEIDYDLTVSTQHGKQALEQLIKCGDVIPATDSYMSKNLIVGSSINQQTGRSYNNISENSNLSRYKFRDKSKSSGDLSFEKYFVTIETYGEENV